MVMISVLCSKIGFPLAEKGHHFRFCPAGAMSFTCLIAIAKADINPANGFW